jgi:hypothetical protein
VLVRQGDRGELFRIEVFEVKRRQARILSRDARLFHSVFAFELVGERLRLFP